MIKRNKQPYLEIMIILLICVKLWALDEIKLRLKKKNECIVGSYVTQNELTQTQTQARRRNRIRRRKRTYGAVETFGWHLHFVELPIRKTLETSGR